MRAEAGSIGEQILARYGTLEGAFRERTVTVDALDRHTDELGRLEGELRATHLKYHLLTTGLLTKEQIAEYGRLRGDTDVAAPTEPAPESGHRSGMQHGPATSHP